MAVWSRGPSGARVLFAGLLFALLAPACASRTASPFVKKKSGFIDVGGHPDVISPVKREDVERVAREALARRAAERAATLPSIEGLDPELKAALAALGKSASASAHIHVAQEYERVGVFDFAVDHYSDALKLEPKNVTALDGRARRWRDAGLMVPALVDAHRARYYNPGSAEVRNTLGTILERRGLCQEALGQYREALRLKPEASWAQQNVQRLADKSCENVQGNPANPVNPVNP